MQPVMGSIHKYAVSPARKLKRYVRKLHYRGVSRYCPVCESRVRGFLPFGVRPRPDVLCPVCESLERHRLIWLFFENETGLFRPPLKKMLHIAPEHCFSGMFSRCANIEYLSADLSCQAMVRMDITDIQYPADSFDVIYCSHVLEHVPDDRKAMRELARVLRPDGWAVLQVPMGPEQTFEDPEVTDPLERERLFGQFNHVRLYGPDYKDRLEESGFEVEVKDYGSRIDEVEQKKYGLKGDREYIYFCRKQA